MKLAISCGGGHTKPTIGGSGDDHAICDLINEVQMILVARVGDPKPGVAFESDVRILSME